MSVRLSLACMVAFAAALAFLFFNHNSLRLDEAQSLWQTSRSVPDLLTTVARDVHVPFYHLLLHFWRMFLGDSVGAARALSFLFYLFAIPAMYMLGRYAYGKSTGLLAALLFTLSPFMNWYASEIRMYTLFVLLTILNQYFFLRIFKEKAGAPWALYGITAIFGVFTHYFFALNLASQAVFFLLFRKRFPAGTLKRLLIAGALVVATFAPWAYTVYHLGEAVNQRPALALPTSVNIFNAFSQFLFGFQSDHLNTFFLSLWPLAMLLSFLALRRTSEERSPITAYFLITLGVSFTLALIVSFLVQPVFVSRYLIFTVPSLYLLILSLLRAYPKVLSYALTGTLVVGMAITLALEIMSPQNPAQEDYRDAVRYLEEHATPGDIIALSSPFTIYPVEYYYRGSAPIATLPLWDRYAHGAIPSFSESELPAQVDSLIRDHANIWVLLSYDQGYQKRVEDYFATHFERTDAVHFSPGLDLYKYKLRYGERPALAPSPVTMAR